MRLSAFVVLFLVSSSLVLGGCATFNRMVTNDALVSQLAVEAATARVIFEHPAWKSTIVKISAGSMAIIDSHVVTDLASVEGYVKEQINWSRLMPEEQALVSTLITQVRKNLEDSFRAQSVVAPAEKMIAVRQVMQWINETASRQ